MIERTVLFGISRWIHLLSVIGVIGTFFALRYVVMPAAGALGEEARLAFHRVAHRRLARIIPVGVTLIFASGLINLFRVLNTPGLPPIYHMIFGIKFLLALALIIIAVLLVIPSESPNFAQRNRRLWITFTVHMALTVVALSVALRFLSSR